MPGPRYGAVVVAFPTGEDARHLLRRCAPGGAVTRLPAGPDVVDPLQAYTAYYRLSAAEHVLACVRHAAPALLRRVDDDDLQLPPVTQVSIRARSVEGDEAVHDGFLACRPQAGSPAYGVKLSQPPMMVATVIGREEERDLAACLEAIPDATVTTVAAGTWVSR